MKKTMNGRRLDFFSNQHQPEKKKTIFSPWGMVIVTVDGPAKSDKPPKGWLKPYK